MKKISIVLTLILSAFIISSCAEKNPNDPNTDNSKKITLAERVGNYTGESMGLSIVFNNNGQVTSVTLNNTLLNAEYPIKVGEPSSTVKEHSFDVKMLDKDGKPTAIVTKVKVIFDSDTEATGGKAYFGVNAEPNMDNPIIIKKVS